MPAETPRKGEIVTFVDLFSVLRSCYWFFSPKVPLIRFSFIADCKVLSTPHSLETLPAKGDGGHGEHRLYLVLRSVVASLRSSLSF